MEQTEKIKYMRMAAGICGFHFKDQHLDLLISLYELIVEKRQDTDLRSIARVELDVEMRGKKRLEDAEIERLQKTIAQNQP